MQFSHQFFENVACEYYPCHPIPEGRHLNCLFCFCPLYPYENCPGTPIWLESGIKDCSACTTTAYEDAYATVIDFIMTAPRNPPQTKSSGGDE
ncbi:MAG: metal-binding protein [Magnetococcales bacterium]|nr:metal-binding protein [Magnetococcales bacterium]NGZ06531.1 metal-binding protein [Magnetococcales bacterium]